MNNYKQVLFNLDQDGSGYPPTSLERLWVSPLENGNFQVENIPFYVMGISSGDEIKVSEKKGELFFDSLVKPSGNSTFRLFVTDSTKIESIRDYLTKLGCVSELNQLVGVIAVEVPRNIHIKPFLDYIVEAKEVGDIDIEEGALHHDIET
jgi:Domain of unknown function (DUF4265)